VRVAATRNGSAPRGAIYAILFYILLYELSLIWSPLPHDLMVSAGEGATVVGLLVAAALCLGRPPWFWLARRKHAPARLLNDQSEQMAPVFLGLAALTFAVLTLLEMVTRSEEQIEVGTSWLEVGFVVMYALVLAAILIMPQNKVSSSARARITLDSLLITTALATFSWYFLIGPTFLQDDQTIVTKLVATSFPVGDLILVFCLAGSWLVAREPEMDRVIVLFALGLGGVLVADSIQDYQLLQGIYVIGGVVDPLRPLGYLIGALGARSLRRLPVSNERPFATGSVRRVARISLWRALAPYIFIPLVCLLLAYILFGTSSTVDVQLEQGVFIGAVVLSTLVVARQILAILENGELNRQLSAHVETLRQLHRSEQEARTEAEEAVLVRERMLAAASHDLRTPLTMILGYLERVSIRLARGNGLEPEWLTTQLTTIGKAADRMLATVEEITDAAQLQAHHELVLHRQRVDIGDILRTITTMFNDTGMGFGRSITLSAPSGLDVECDHARMERVMQNIIGNALKYSLSGTPVTVQARDAGECVVIDVCDSGVGIPSAEIPNIFTHFYRASTSMGIPGTGIGLAGSKQIVEQHGGTIELVSLLGQGTQVKITMPRAMQKSDSEHIMLPDNESERAWAVMA
jgi:signal transduction histidine kinase